MKPVEPHLRAEIEWAAAQYESIAADLRRALAEGYPEPSEDTPLIDQITLGTRTVPILEGVSGGHLVLADGAYARN